jgi:DNA-binding beta-propeller fold protein YncE
LLTPFVAKTHDITPQSTYKVVKDWPELGEYKLGATSGIDLDSAGNVILIHRAGAKWGNKELISEPIVMRLDAEDGRVLAAWGSNIFASPHGLKIDSKDNIWVTDVALNKVFKFSPQGDLLLTVGDDYTFLQKICLSIRKRFNLTSCTDDPHIFAMPTDIIVTNSGEFYVTDGHLNRRIAKFSENGKFLFEWGSHGKGPGQLDLPHGITQDAKGNLYVADRNNARIQVFDSKGNYLTLWKKKDLGRPYNMDFGPDGYLYVVDGGDQDPAHPRGRVVKMDTEGNIVERWGSFGRKLGQFDEGHDIAVGPDGSVYVVDIYGKRVQKFRKSILRD